MTYKLLLPTLALMLAVLACTLPGVRVSTTVPVPPTVSPLTLDMLRNGTYFAPAYQRTVTLVDGSYSENTSVGTYSVQMLNVYAFGDLNGDGLNDAAILLAENGGGSGVFESLVAVLNRGGTPHQAGQAELGDRVQITSATISSGKIALDMVVHGPNDPLCCPTRPGMQVYRLIENTLWLTRLTSTTPSGDQRTIDISSPADGDSVTNPFSVEGSVTIAPFENNLVYRVYLPDGTLINESSLIVDSGGIMGGPGTFAQEFNLSNAGVTGTIIVQFLDLSAADGSTLALDSVVLVLQ